MKSSLIEKDDSMTLNAPQSTHLWSTKNGADKVYNAFLRPKGEGWVVDYSNGKRGGTLQTGTRTGTPVSFDEALKIYGTLVKSKLKDGYGPVSTGEAYTSSEFAGRATGLDVQLLSSIDDEACAELINDDAWAMQVKENGERRPLFVREGVVTGANRNGLLVDVPHLWLNELAQLGKVDLDGEHVGNVYCVFDLLGQDGQDLRSLPFKARYLRLTQLLDSLSVSPACLRLVEAMVTTAQKSQLMSYVRRENLEGVVFKKLSAPYGAGGRSKDALKFKLVDEATCVVMAINQQRSVVLGLLDAQRKLVPQGNVTIPVNHDIPVVGSLIEVSFLYYTGKAFEQPVYVKPRPDLSQEDARMGQITRIKPVDQKQAALA